MTGTPESSPLGTAQRWVLVLIAVALAMGLVVPGAEGVAHGVDDAQRGDVEGDAGHVGPR